MKNVQCTICIGYIHVMVFVYFVVYVCNATREGICNVCECEWCVAVVERGIYNYYFSVGLVASWLLDLTSTH